MRGQALILVLLFCTVSSLSLSSHAALTPAPVRSLTECLTCRVIFKELISRLEANTTMNIVIRELDLICDTVLPTKDQEKCRNFTTKMIQTGEAILPFILKREDYNQATLCTMLSYCQEPCCSQTHPEQVHIALAGDSISSMVVMWVTLNQDESIVRYSSNADSLNTISNGSQHTYSFGGWSGFIHKVYLNDLLSDTKYYYQAGGSQYGYSQVFSFRTFATKRDTYRFAMIGDMGVDPEAEPTMAALSDLVQKEQIDLIIHNGDIAYADGYQHRWDEYFRRVESIIANIPYMVCPGNHEIFYVNALSIFGYDQRFVMPGKESGTNSNTFYSFNYGPVHFIALNSESTANVAAISADQLKWLKADLEKASQNRSQQPWIVAYFHRPLYCSNDDYPNCKLMAETLRYLMEDLFYNYRVNLVIQAHKHGYERTQPVYQEKVKGMGDAPIYIVNGAGGNREGTTAFPPKSESPSWADVQIPEWGYGVLEANSSQLTWSFFTSSDRKMKDSVTLPLKK